MHAAPITDEPDFSSCAVLIADDVPMNRLILREACGALGISRVTEAADGNEAMEYLERESCDLVLLDILMPEADGLEVCRYIRTQPRFEGMPILVQTAMQDEKDRLRCFASGATDVVLKPLSIPELQARIRVHLANHLLTRDLNRFKARIDTHMGLIGKALLDHMPPEQELTRTLDDAGYTLNLAHTRAEEIGGDLWKCWQLPGGDLCFALFDASGHGLAAAIHALSFSALLDAVEVDRLPTAQHIFQWLDERIAAIPGRGFMVAGTAVTLSRQRDEISFMVAGNPPIHWCRKDGVVPLPTSGPPLGANLLLLEEHSISVMPGEALAIFTDGWPGEGKRATDLLKRYAAAGPDDAHSVIADASSHDDASFFYLKRNPS